jgi:hypothetical protein
MRVLIDLPDWVDERHIYIFAGVELAAQKLSFNNFWQIKDTRCNQCGKCCMNFKNIKHYYPVVNGRCVHLQERGDGKYNCGILIHRSSACGIDPSHHIKRGECCITYANNML